ncbi:tetratricopeptide repeat protein [Kordia sp.]|uniref:tetratricopeptide repeat protein n=1 Tax=Kordia sp. TaxID=1965332 RepID=UPI003D2B5FCF
MKYHALLLLILCMKTSFAQNLEEISVNFAVNDTINDAKVIEFANLLQTSLYALDTEFFLTNFDSESFAAKVLMNDEESLQNKDIRTFNKAFTDGFLKKFDVFPVKITQTIENKASYDVVNYYYDELEKKYHLLFRVYSDTDGLNYHDYQLNYVNKKFKIEDIYIYTTGEYLSDTIKQLYLINLPKTYLDDIDVNKNRLNTILFFYNYQKLIAQEKYKEAYDVLSNLEGDIKEQKVIYIMKIQVASVISEIYYMEAIDELLKKFPNDPSTQLMAVDYYVMLKNYNATMASLQALEIATSDTFIEYIRGNLAWEFNDYEGAEKAYKATMKEYPDFEAARLNLLYMYDEAKLFEACIEMLDTFVANGFYTKQDLINFIDDTKNELKNIPTAELYKQWKEKK